MIYSYGTGAMGVEELHSVAIFGIKKMDKLPSVKICTNCPKRKIANWYKEGNIIYTG